MRRSRVNRSEAFLVQPNLLVGLRPLGKSELRPKNSILFRQGENSNGGYLLEEGQARLSMTSDRGDTITARTVGPGYLLGLPGTILNRSYLFTAKLTRESRVSFIPTQALLEHLRVHSDLCFEIVEMLGGELLDLPQTALTRSKRSKRSRSNA